MVAIMFCALVVHGVDWKKTDTRSVAEPLDRKGDQKHRRTRAAFWAPAVLLVFREVQPEGVVRIYWEASATNLTEGCL